MQFSSNSYILSLNRCVRIQKCFETGRYCMNKIETLKGGTTVHVRDLSLDDIEQLHGFFKSLPVEDRRYLRIDVTQKGAVEWRLRTSSSGKDARVIALLDDEVVAYGALEISPEEWHRHQGELRVLVSRSHQRKGLGMIMMRELYLVAARRQIKEVIVKMMGPQMAAMSICKRLGFKQESLLHDYVMDQNGNLQDLVVMTCDMDALWRELESLYMGSDWQRCR